MLKRLSLLCCLFLLPGLANAAIFDITRTFEGGTLGQPATSATGFSGLASDCTYSNDFAREGTQSAKNRLVEGSQGANHGGHVNITVALGEEVWSGAYLYFKSPWSWACQPPCGEGSEVKVMRLHRTTGGFQTLVTPSNQTPYIHLETTGANHLQNKNLPATTFTTFDQWIWVEWYIRVAASGDIRMWINGILKLEYLGINTNTALDQANFFVYWNSGPDITQHVYIDRLRITNDPTVATQTDGSGNKMIGPITGVTPPSAPTNLRIQ